MARLGDICTKASSGIKQSDLENSNGEYPIFGASGFIKNVDFYQQDKPYVAVVKDGAGVGRVMYLPAFSSVIGTMQYIIPNAGVDAGYLAYAMEHMNLAKYYTGATIPHIYFKDYCKEELPSHTEDGQIKISRVLDKVCDLISLRKRQLAKLDELVKAWFVEMFGDPVLNNSHWKQVPVGDICFVTKLAGFEYTDYIHYQDSGEVIMIRGLNVKDTHLKLNDIYYIDAAVSDMLPRSQLKENDIVMTYVGVNIGDVALVDGKHRYHLAPNVAKISPNSYENLNPIFFVNLLSFNKQNFASNATNTAKQALNMDKIRKLSVMLPPVELQNKFAGFVEDINKLKSTVQQGLDSLETLKKALMQKYFG